MTETLNTEQKNKKSSIFKIIIGLSVISAACFGIYVYYLHSINYPSTDNAYVNANLINIAPKVSGYIQAVYVKENQLVHKGDILLEIDAQDYNLQLLRVNHDLKLAKEQESSAHMQVKSAQASLVKAQADFAFANQMAIRYATLYKQNAGSLQDMQKYQNQLAQAAQQLEQARVILAQAVTDHNAMLTRIDIASTTIADAKNNIEHTKLFAPIDGYVTNLNLRSGEFVSVGQKIFGLVDNNEWWVDVNFKETQLKRIKPGQTAIVELDMYDHKYLGVVESVSFASGNTFSLLPAQNATGNWVKVTQRFTVRVKLENNLQFPLKVGASTNVSVDTTK